MTTHTRTILVVTFGSYWRILRNAIVYFQPLIKSAYLYSVWVRWHLCTRQSRRDFCNSKGSILLYSKGKSMKILWKQGSESRERKCVMVRDQILPTQGIYSLKKKKKKRQMASFLDCAAWSCLLLPAVFVLNYCSYFRVFPGTLSTVRAQNISACRMLHSLSNPLGANFRFCGYFSKTALIRSYKQERTLKCVITLAFPLSLNLHLPFFFFFSFQSTLAIFIHLQRSMLVCQCFHVLMRCVHACVGCVCVKYTAEIECLLYAAECCSSTSSLRLYRRLNCWYTLHLPFQSFPRLPQNLLHQWWAVTVWECN